MKSRISDKTRRKRGLGRGEGVHYKPYLRPRHVPSKGCTTRVLGHKIKREHVVLSNLELEVLYLLDFDHSYSLTDIQEQFPLEISITQEIASHLNIRHPNHEGKDVVMTTDFLVTKGHNEPVTKVALAVKPSSKLSARVIEKFQIEKEFWARQNVPWRIITEKEIDPIRLNNVRVLREYYKMESSFTASVLDEFRLSVGSSTLRDFLNETAIKLRIQFGECLRVFYHLLSTKQIWLDVSSNLNLDISLSNFKLYHHETSY